MIAILVAFNHMPGHVVMRTSSAVERMTTFVL